MTNNHDTWGKISQVHLDGTPGWGGWMATFKARGKPRRAFLMHKSKLPVWCYYIHSILCYQSYSTKALLSMPFLSLLSASRPLSFPNSFTIPMQVTIIPRSILLLDHEHWKKDNECKIWIYLFEELLSHLSTTKPPSQIIRECILSNLPPKQFISTEREIGGGEGKWRN